MEVSSGPPRLCRPVSATSPLLTRPSPRLFPRSLSPLPGPARPLRPRGAGSVRFKLELPARVRPLYKIQAASAPARRQLTVRLTETTEPAA